MDLGNLTKSIILIIAHVLKNIFFMWAGSEGGERVEREKGEGGEGERDS